MSPNWSQKSSKMDPKLPKMRSWKHPVLRLVPKQLPDPHQDQFWRGFGTFLGSLFVFVECMLGGFCMRLLATGCKQRCSIVQSELRLIQQMLGESINGVSICDASCATSPVLLLRSRVAWMHDMIRRRNNRLIDR